MCVEAEDSIMEKILPFCVGPKASAFLSFFTRLAISAAQFGRNFSRANNLAFKLKKTFKVST